MSIRTRLTLWYSSLLAVVILVFGISLFSVLHIAWRDELDSSLTAIAQQVGNQIQWDANHNMTVKLRDLGDDVGISPFYVQVWDIFGRLVGTSNGNYQYALDAETINTPQAIWHEFTLSGRHFYVLTIPLKDHGQLVGSVQVATRLDAIDEATDRLLKIMIGVGVVAMLLSFFIGSMITGQALQPIDTIAQAAAQITAADDLSRRIPYEGPDDELGQLTTTFNATLGRLERLFNAQRRFVADVSHELRTPLTTLQGNLDLIKRMGPDPISIEAMTSEISRMSRLVGDLLLLARADSGNLPMNETTVDLDTLVLEVFRQGRILGPQLQFKLETIEPARVRGDSDRLKQLLLNLVTNAIKYTPSGGTVTLSLTVADSEALIKVADTGMGIPKNDLPMIFDRFYRVDKARSREMGGSGLGLSIASWIAQSHEGRIVAESEDDKGSVFTIHLPILETPAIPESMRETRPRIPLPARVRLRSQVRSGDEEDVVTKEPVIKEKPA